MDFVTKQGKDLLTNGVKNKIIQSDMCSKILGMARANKLIFEELLKPAILQKLKHIEGHESSK